MIDGIWLVVSFIYIGGVLLGYGRTGVWRWR